MAPRRRRRRRKRKYMSYAQTAVKALRIANNVAGMLNTEKKRTELSVGPLNITNAQAPLDVLGGNISQGAGALNERVGDSIKLKLLQLKGTLTYNPTLGGVQRIRVLLLWKPEVIALSNVQILADAGTADTTTSFYTWDNKPYFHILMDRTYTLSSDRQQVFLNMTKRLNKHVKFQTGSSALKTNELVLFPVSDTGVGAGNFPQFTANIRIQYLDN